MSARSAIVITPQRWTCPSAVPAVRALACEIQTYLLAHPSSADTAEHIARWWLLRQRAEAALSLTQDALDHLEAAGVVECSDAGVYRLCRGAPA